MELVKSNNIYIDIGDNQYQLIKNEHIYEFKKYYFKNEIKIRYGNNIIMVDLKNEKYFQIKIINIGNYILLYVYNKEYLFYYNTISNINNIYDNQYDLNKFLVYQLNRLIIILRSKLGKEIQLPDDIIFKITNKLNIIEKTMSELNTQKILYYKEYIKKTFLI